MHRHWNKIRPLPEKYRKQESAIEEVSFFSNEMNGTAKNLLREAEQCTKGSKIT